MRKVSLLLFIIVLSCVFRVSAFPIETTLNSWMKGTIPRDQYVNIAQIETPYGEGISVNTSGYPGAYQYNYEFFAYYNERFIVPPSGRVEVDGYFMYKDVTPHHDRKYLSLYLLRPDLSSLITNITRVLDYTQGDAVGVWYHRHVVVFDLEPGEEFMLAIGRGDKCDTDRKLQAAWANVNVFSCRTLRVPSQFSTIQQAISEAVPGDTIQVASGTYREHITVDQDYLAITGESSRATIVDVRMENGSDQAVINITKRYVLISHLTIMGRPETDGIIVSGDDAVITECNITNNDSGIRVLADNVKIMRNDIHNNSEGMWMESGVESCTIYYNNFFNNNINVFNEQFPGLNTWHNGYAGNFWSNYTSVDTDGNGIGDDPHIIDSKNIDYYPLMSPYRCGDVNYDNRINMLDVGFVARRFGCVRTDPLWNPHADLNEDNQINMKDIAITARRFGQEW